ncbi:response regulator receiver protein [Microvirga vignae]|uniref:Response regulator receiver protein n=1 Tax=Microvirga vignae TaxID=1225564 RepID=A0A0H1RQR7_9HYPH|nr:response regulator [Microvirga vignae]KLK95012.1 response regulator receiver protein [Microvirga vignae]
MGRKIGSNCVALIVEDDVELRTLAVKLLEETDLNVVEVSCCEEALCYLNFNGGKVAFLFAEAKGSRLISGVDLARTARLRWPRIRTVLTSGEPLEEDLHKTLRNVRFMLKPWMALEVLIEAEKATRQAIQ